MGSATEPAGRSPLPTGQRPAVRDVVRDVLAETAPEEVPLYEALNSRFDDDRVVRLLSRRTRRREPLGFGLNDLVPLAMPVVWLALDEVARRGVEAAADSVTSRLRAGIRRIFRRTRAAPRTVPALTREQIAAVRQRVLEKADEAGIRGERAVALADGVIARLVLELPGGPTPLRSPDRAVEKGGSDESVASD